MREQGLRVFQLKVGEIFQDTFKLFWRLLFNVIRLTEKAFQHKVLCIDAKRIPVTRNFQRSVITQKNKVDLSLLMDPRKKMSTANIGETETRKDKNAGAFLTSTTRDPVFRHDTFIHSYAVIFE